MSRWLEDSYRLLLLDEPYKGIDIGAKDDINEAIRAMAGAGRGVIVISTEFAELIGLVSDASRDRQPQDREHAHRSVDHAS